MNALDKEEFRIKLEEINKLVQDKDYKGAMNIVDSIDWRRVKNVRTLCVVGEIYAANGRYEDSKEIFLLAYHKASIGKNILYRLIEISLRMDDINEAEEFFEEYKQVASNDSTQYILQYKIARAKNSSLNEQIRILEEYKEQEFTEKWSYELAALYYKAGEKQKCLDLCNEIILWFSEGKYVMKAYDLKMRMGELTGAEKAKFEKQFVPKLLTPEQAKELEKKKTETEVKAQEEPEAEEVEETTENNEPEVQVSMEGIQEKISKGIRDVFGGKTQEEKEEFPEESMDMVNEAGITREDEIPEEIIKSDASQKEPENVPELEAEPEKPGAEPMAAIKMPELNIPASMKNMELSKPPKVEEVAETKLNMDSFDLEGKELNLEDTILAAASAQGIEIPKEEESKTEEVQEESSETDVDDKEIKAHDISEELEEPDFLSGDIQDIKVADPKPDEEPKKEIPVQPEIEEDDEEEDEVTENLLDTVLIPTDFSRKSLEALNVIRSLREYVGKVLFVHVVEHSRNKHDYKEKYGSAKMFLQELVDEMKIFGIEADYRIAHGVASKKIAAICERDNVSLIMMTKTGADMTNGDDLGSTSENVVLNSDCAVMLLPAEDSDEEDTFS